MPGWQGSGWHESGREESGREESGRQESGRQEVRFARTAGWRDGLLCECR